ncbi:hypothetical protein [Phormidium tenue]|uniref:Uncharacterized protein n=1 Tax=Phormidium tenue NIES-30 TaxID=549789 RepID=A0A1U7J8G9_9CYAN|nr:hypothetical protein [Phormidium tenue]MBD2231395.1 hypothetical protein [Phormidium tenue FACHB-1052]OKH49623.1 hypothetical protein NIES30_07265 [Phormidium tenue NIES-30]
MNRFIIGGILAALVMMLTGGLNRLTGDRNPEGGLASQQDTTAQNADGLGSLPIEQAGRLAQRQSEVGTNGTAATGNSSFTDQGSNRATISPANTGTVGTNTGTTGANGVNPAPGNVIPRTGAATTYPTSGDIAPIQPSLVQSDAVQRPAPDPDLDSIPALW